MEPENADIVGALQELGFTELEGEVYLFLLRHPPATGYGIAKGVGRTNANTYKALQSLEATGAVLVQEDEPRRVRAVPWEELLGQLQRRFEARRERAAEVLARVQRSQVDDGVYSLATREQVLERATKMLGEARHVAVANIFPSLVKDLASSLQITAERGVRVLIKAYAPVELPGVEVVLRRQGGQITQPWGSDALSLNIDGREHLLADLEPGGDPDQAVWTASPSLAFKLYYTLIYELILTDLQQRILAGEGNAKLRSLLDHYADLHPISSGSAIFEEYRQRVGSARGKKEID